MLRSQRLAHSPTHLTNSLSPLIDPKNCPQRFCSSDSSSHLLTLASASTHSISLPLSYTSSQKTKIYLSSQVYSYHVRAQISSPICTKMYLHISKTIWVCPFFRAGGDIFKILMGIFVRYTAWADLFDLRCDIRVLWMSCPASVLSPPMI